MKKSNQQKYFLMSAMFLASVVALYGCAGPKVLTMPSEPQKMLHISELKHWDETRSLNNYVIYLNKGETFPLKLTMDTDFMGFKQQQVDIIAKQKLYFMIKMPENLSPEQIARLNKLDAQRFSQLSAAEKKEFFKQYMLYLSRDAVHWAPMYSPKAVREVMGIKSGTVSLGMMANTSEGLGASLILRAIK